jgi:hypothetical protein
MPQCKGLVSSPEQATAFPLLDRGWVYQGRLLSRRVLHFQNNELSWECSSEYTCKCGDRGKMIRTFIQPPFHHLKVGGHPNPKTGQGCLHAERSLMLNAHRWHELVEEYSGLKISFQKATLPTLAGLVRQMCRYCEGDIYIYCRHVERDDRDRYALVR